MNTQASSLVDKRGFSQKISLDKLANTRSHTSIKSKSQILVLDSSPNDFSYKIFFSRPLYKGDKLQQSIIVESQLYIKYLQRVSKVVILQELKRFIHHPTILQAFLLLLSNCLLKLFYASFNPH